MLIKGTLKKLLSIMATSIILILSNGCRNHIATQEQNMYLEIKLRKFDYTSIDTSLYVETIDNEGILKYRVKHKNTYAGLEKNVLTYPWINNTCLYLEPEKYYLILDIKREKESFISSVFIVDRNKNEMFYYSIFKSNGNKIIGIIPDPYIEYEFIEISVFENPGMIYL